jgi:hypothetical protein
MIAVTICSTRSYAYALIAQARKIVACIEREPEGVVILIGDNSLEINKAKEFYQSILPEGWKVELYIGKFEDGLPNYQNPAQLIIARMRSIAYDRARQLHVDFCWSLDSDVLPQPNALRVMKQMLEFDDGYYSISTCPYPSQGGGAFLGGRGTPEHPILPDFYDDEREIPKDLKKKMDQHKAKLKTLKSRPNAKLIQQFRELSKAVQNCKPTGNVFHCNSKGFRRRGWMHAAYPEIGIGAVVPTDWCGLGCTLMNREALSLAQFDGYDGSGTEDLYIVWKRWYRKGLKINVIPHSPCDHVIRDRAKKGKFILCQAYHESKNPETVGHLRMELRPWYQQTVGEKFSQNNDGMMTSKPR